jgi:phage-related protein
MARGKAHLEIEILADASQALSGLNKAEAAVKEYGDAASTATRQSRDVSGAIDSVGGVAGGATTGLRDMSDAIAMAGFPELAAGMGVTATALESLDGAATLYAAAQEGLTKVVGIFNGVMQALKLTILTNPIFIIAAIIIAIGAAFVIAYMKCETFRNIVDAAFDVILGAVKAVWNWITNNWPLLLGILGGPFGLAVALIIRYRDDIWDAIRAVWDWISSNWSKISGWLTAPFRTAWDTISGIFDKIRNAIDTVMDLIGKIKFPSPPSWIPIIGGKASFAAPGVAHIATRGVAATTGPSGSTVNITVNAGGLGANSPQIQRAVVNALRGYVARNGALDVPVRTA